MLRHCAAFAAAAVAEVAVDESGAATLPGLLRLTVFRFFPSVVVVAENCRFWPVVVGAPAGGGGGGGGWPVDMPRG